MRCPVYDRIDVCKDVAIYNVYWPGLSKPFAVCHHHALEFVTVGNHLGLGPRLEKIEDPVIHEYRSTRAPKPLESPT